MISSKVAMLRNRCYASKVAMLRNRRYASKVAMLKVWGFLAYKTAQDRQIQRWLL